ncbi:MAG: cytochrome d ubiquinol oxidase subunit II [Spirochaetes bacterium]|nr:cytochrome d ubiquinol oxidase subunit II [Spirochaetota bacterium]
MEFIDILRNIWFILIGVLFIGYTILDGFDLGVGMLMPFIAKDDADKKKLINSIWPVWDGNEVWLIAGAGALFAAFPAAYAAVFSGFYLLFMLTLFALIFRAVSMEFWHYDIKRKKLWAAAFSIGSFFPPLFFGLIIGNVMLGLPLNDKFQFTSDLSVIFRPFPVLAAVLVIVFMIIHGASYVALKTEGALHDKAESAALKLWPFAVFLFIIAVISIFFFFPERSVNPLMWIFSLLIFIVLFTFRLSMKRMKIWKSGFTFILSSVVLACLWICAGVLLYPNLLNSTGGGNSLSIYNASSSELTLLIMFVFALIGMPVVIAYTIFVYRIFKGKVKE